MQDSTRKVVNVVLVVLIAYFLLGLVGVLPAQYNVLNTQVSTLNLGTYSVSKREIPYGRGEVKDICIDENNDIWYVQTYKNGISKIDSDTGRIKTYFLNQTYWEYSFFFQIEFYDNSIYAYDNFQSIYKISDGHLENMNLRPYYYLTNNYAFGYHFVIDNDGYIWVRTYEYPYNNLARITFNQTVDMYYLNQSSYAESIMFNSNTGNLWIYDTVNYLFTEMDTNAQVLNSYDTSTLPSPFYEVEILQDGNIWMLEGNQAVIKWNPDGYTQYGLPDSGWYFNTNMNSKTVDSEGNFYITATSDDQQSRVYKLSPEGEWSSIDIINPDKDIDGTYLSIFAIAVDDEGSIYTGDILNSYIHKTTNDNEQEDFKLNMLSGYPQKMALDNQNNLYITTMDKKLYYMTPTQLIKYETPSYGYPNYYFTLEDVIYDEKTDSIWYDYPYAGYFDIDYTVNIVNWERDGSHSDYTIPSKGWIGQMDMDSEGNIWYCEDYQNYNIGVIKKEGGIEEYEFPVFTIPHAFTITDDDLIYISGYQGWQNDGRLWMFNPNTEEFKYWISPYEGYMLMDCVHDDDNNIWIAFFSETNYKIVKFDTTSEQFTEIYESQLYYEIRNLKFDKQNKYIWFTMNEMTGTGDIWRSGNERIYAMDKSGSSVVALNFLVSYQGWGNIRDLEFDYTNNRLYYTFFWNYYGNSYIGVIQFPAKPTGGITVINAGKWTINTGDGMTADVNQPINIQAQIINEDGIQNARIYYEVNTPTTSEYLPIEMTLVSGTIYDGIWEGQLPKQSSYCTIDFHISAETQEGETITSNTYMITVGQEQGGLPSISTQQIFYGMGLILLSAVAVVVNRPPQVGQWRRSWD